MKASVVFLTFELFTSIFSACLVLLVFRSNLFLANFSGSIKMFYLALDGACYLTGFVILLALLLCSL